MPLNSTLRREARVAFSRKAQPVWFRVTKWIVALVVVARYWDAPAFWWWVLIATVVAVALHLFWRYKTKVWTRPWGGWSDIEAGKG